MPAAAADSTLYRSLMGDEDTARLFTDSAEVRAMLLVEGTLAQVQGGLGLIPAEAAAFIQRASHEVQIDPAALGGSVAVNGVPVPGLIAGFAKAMNAPDMAQYLHWGATSQDIMDTAQALRLRRVMDLWDQRLAELVRALGALAQDHADLAMAGRSYGQVAVPTSFGAVVAGWGHAVQRHRVRLAAVRGDVLVVSLGGAAGTLSAMGPLGPQVRAGLAQALNLTDPLQGWHSERDGIAAFAGWMAGLAGSLGKMAEDVLLLTQSGIAEVRIAGAGGSSTMPQKQNPVGASVVVALSRQIIGLSATLHGAALHRQQRDGAAWFTEWLTLPQMCISTGAALVQALTLASRITPDPAAMARGLEDGLGLIHAETLSFALARLMPRPQAQAQVKTLCAEAIASGVPLPQLVARDFPGLDLDLSSAAQLGQAPAEARAFALGALPPN